MDVVVRGTSVEVWIPRAAEVAAGKDEGPKVDFVLVVEPPAADTAAQRKALDGRVLHDDIDAWLWITPQVFADSQYEMIQEEQKQNVELIEQGKRIEQLTQSVLALTQEVHAALGKREG